ncbi:MAG: AAA family ATPase [Candidatus Vogelbacteria bacterium]|nr:AAA family ATPase [Candidatus Vogelbacteria bacterium]
MLYLKKIELLGFKSFAKKTELIFNVPITSIVGPNGSGKSNVAEAFRWVLGEQSMKSLRGKRGEDLIFNGSAGAPKQNHAYVTLVFDNKDKKFNIDFDEVAISRHIYRDGSNQYFINGSQVRLKDIIELLSVVSLGVSSHHIISQGEADRILNANIYERREMIEDALGLRVYQYKKHESERKLEKTEENIKQVESLKRELAPHLKFLKKQVEQVEKAEQMKRELFNFYVEYLWREELYLKNFRSQIDKERMGPSDELKKVEAELNRLAALLSSSNAEDNEKFNRLRDVDNKLQEVRRKKDEFSRRIGRLEGMIEANPIKEMMEEQAKAENKTCPYCGQTMPVKEIGQPDSAFTAKIEEEIKRHQAEKLEAEEQLKTLQIRESELVSAYSSVKSEIDKHKDSLRDSERTLYGLRAKKSDLLSALNSIHAKEDKFNYEEGAFNMELTESAVLVGRVIIDEYKKFVWEGVDPLLEDRMIQDDRRRKIERIKIRLEDMGGSGEEVMKEFKETEERDKFLEKEITDLLQSAESLRTVMKELSDKIDTEFKAGINKINIQFKEFFMLMFGGGEASLVLQTPPKKETEDGMPVLELEDEEKKQDGIDISVSLPRKRVKGLQMLSGGERALTSIALLFAVSQVNPPPFLILDETDAALDESNSRKYGDMIENLSKLSQLIVVTHNRETMSRANVLYGVTMGSDGVSKLISIKFDDAVAIAK